MDNRPSVELLESTHQFPGSYQMKVIGQTDDGFTDRLLKAVQEELAAPSDLDHTLRETPNGRHVAITLELIVQTPEQVRSIYARVGEVPGVTLVF